VHHFGEAGRQHFHIISQYSAKYDSVKCDKQYTACLRHKGSNQATIATFYYYCKLAGVQIYSERTRKIAYSAQHGKKGGLSAKQVADNLQKFEDITDSIEIVKQVMDNDIELKGEDCLIDQVELWIRQTYDLQRNEITRYIENNGEIIKQKDFNSIYIKGKKVFDKLTYDMVDRLINSDFIDDYNPFTRFFDEHKDIKSTGHIEALFKSVNAKDGQFLQHFGKKWVVSIISSIHGEHSPLMLVLSGEIQGTGKTEFFRRLLPKELQKYYAESKLDAGKDDEILMTQKLLIMDDEMGGKSKKESKRLKELTSKQTFSLREPYGRNNVDLNRLAVLCGTTNDNEILNDPTGNRRIIPIQVTSINHDCYNRVDKVALFMEAYHLWQSGFQWKLDRHDIDYLGMDNKSFEVTSLEAELIQKFYEPGNDDYGCEYLTASEIKVDIEDKTRQKLLLDKIGKELKRLGFVQEVRKLDGRPRRVYNVRKVAQLPKTGLEIPNPF
jgi:predicted P-loop ATPase